MQTLGLDVGGATLKAATSDGEARSRKFALWKHPEKLADELQTVIAGFRFDRVAVVMTGELCDCFETRRAGVRHIVHAVQAALERSNLQRPCEIRFWNTGGEFVSPEAAMTESVDRVQAANWHATATWIARTHRCRNGLLIDIGSTNVRHHSHLRRKTGNDRHDRRRAIDGRRIGVFGGRADAGLRDTAGSDR